MMGPFIEETGGLEKWHKVTMKTLCRSEEDGEGSTNTSAAVLVAVLGAFTEFNSFVLFMRTIVLEARQARFASGKEDMPAMPAMPATPAGSRSGGGAASKLNSK
jgi:hypothetical protein